MELTPAQLRAIHAKNIINKDYPTIFRTTAQKKGCLGNEKGFIRYDKNGNPEKVEAVCGASTEAISEHLKNKLGKDSSKRVIGYYRGIGSEHSNPIPHIPDQDNSTQGMVGHEWIKLPDGTIVDGARGQFLPNNLKRDDLTKKDRLKFIPPNSPEQAMYVVRTTCKRCGTALLPNQKCYGCKVFDELTREAKRRGISIMELNEQRIKEKYGS